MSRRRSFGRDLLETVIGIEMRWELRTVSSEVDLQPDYLALYSAILKELAWYSQQMGSTTNSATLEVLVADRELLLDLLASYFGINKEVVVKHFRDWLI